MVAGLGLGKPKRNPGREVEWAFEWEEGGGNSVMASSRAEAIRRARKLSKKLTPIVDSFTSDPRAVAEHRDWLRRMTS